MIDTSFNFYSDSNGGDPDSKSPTLKKYHKFLWSKKLPSGHYFELTDNKKGCYLYHESDLGKFYLGSDAITHSYKHHKKKKHIVSQVPDEVNELYDKGSTIGGYIIFPNNSVNGKHTINQSRGVRKIIDDRFDLTLECIRRFYLGEYSPLSDTLLRYQSFFELFTDFRGYVQFFLLEDLVNEDYQINFYLPFNDFNSLPIFNGVPDYLTYKKGVENFVTKRNKRIEQYELSLREE